MLFNSFPFLLAFLPAALLAYQIASRFGKRPVIVTMGLFSVAFYAYWKPEFLLVLVPSILVNFLFASMISRRLPNNISTRLLLWLAVAFNLGLLCWFKYLFPLLNFFHRHMHVGNGWRDVILPLGISFFTFTQLGYIIDLQQGSAEPQNFWNYLLFVTFFPHLIAGPILHHHDIMPQFERGGDYSLRAEDLAVGLSWFTMGLFKKVGIADPLSPMVDAVFSSNGAVGPSHAWIGALAYVAQLYFDFSGYSDMACGLARMFSIDFPLNFSSPFKAKSVIEFWTRWHMTLSQYIGAYLYSPIQFQISRWRLEHGKKVSKKAQMTLEGYLQMIALPTMLTMFLAGVWHGAGVQFLIFGLLHGFYLSVNHGWRNFKHYRGITRLPGVRGQMMSVVSVLLTFSGVVLTLIFFRAADTHQAFYLLKRMVGLHVATSGSLLGGYRPPITFLPRLALCYFMIWAMPNTQQILARYKPALRLAPTDEGPRAVPIYWSPNVAWALILGFGLVFAMVNLLNPSSFLYFQF